MNRLVLFVVFALLATSFAKDEVKDSVTKKDQKAQPGKIGSGTSQISCYQCNSATQGQEECSSSDADSLKKFVKPCPALPEGSTLQGASVAKSCRKIEQNVVGDEPRIIRECAYTGDEELDGKKRTGNKGIISYFYVCFNEENGTPCNPSSQAVFSLGALVAVVLVHFYQRL
ncbi:hypothetical protein FO519_008462 [Halicephalobus sp. NKZ332]|nr:hypothetical protein FO519_008462 [Halicephalobus sp. NKZ332]